MSDTPSPLQTAGYILFALAVIAAVVVGGWQAGWWFTAQNVQKQAHINRTSYEAQKTYRDKIVADQTTIATITAQIADPSTTTDQKQALTAQRTAVVNEVCQVATNLTASDLPTVIVTFVTSNCPEGTLAS